jgi:hypothetical protein
MILCPFCFKTPHHTIDGSFICEQCIYSFALSINGIYLAIRFQDLTINIVPFDKEKQQVTIYKNKIETDCFDIQKFELCESLQVLNKIFKFKHML